MEGCSTPPAQRSLLVQVIGSEPGLLWGVSALSHDASLSVLLDGELVFAGHAERYSGQKNDPNLTGGIIQDAMKWGIPEAIAWYERPYLKKLRHLRAGQLRDAFSSSDLPSQYLRSLHLPFAFRRVDHYSDHHASHRLAGTSTSNFEDAVVMTADSIGEFATLTIGRHNRPSGYTSLHQLNYPHSLGLLYSAFTRRCGFRPNEDEYVLMGMASYGEPVFVDEIYRDLLEVKFPTFRMRFNPHRGIGNWMPDAKPADLAASVQRVVEDTLLRAAKWAREQTAAVNLVLAGGVALNCVANSRLASEAGFERVWVFPNPGDAGSSFGAAVDLWRGDVTWRGPYLGTDISGPYPVDRLLKDLLRTGVTAVANGRAEFGPRALGNRSILADPRQLDMQDRINDVKGRERFRPFAPVIRKERAAEFFDMPVAESPFMQFTSRSRTPAYLPAITHHDGTSRVQTVAKHQHPGLYELLEKWEEATGCPALLNTSLNVRSRPLVNTQNDAELFTSATGLRVW